MTVCERITYRNARLSVSVYAIAVNALMLVLGLLMSVFLKMVTTDLTLPKVPLSYRADCT